MLVGVATGQQLQPSKSPFTHAVSSFTCVRDARPDSLLRGAPRQDGCRVEFHVVNGVRKMGQTIGKDGMPTGGTEIPNVTGVREIVQLGADGKVIGAPGAKVPKEISDFVKAFFAGKADPLGAFAK